MEHVPWPERRSPRLQGFDYAEPLCYFVTICTEERRHLFVQPELNNALVTLLMDHADAHSVMVRAWCLMPDHLHLLVQLPEGGLTLSTWVGSFKGLASTLTRSLGLQGRLWQARFYDHVLRQQESIEKVAQYIINNPVRAGLAGTCNEYPWSGMGEEDKM